ncbi:cytochrome c-type biogenesis protein CcmH, partial [Escherichia coli]|uniref:cytochrome c-type biogenesis protein CcmH n=1 Tax=Escherichia coli TaxID=562 RepID=UPI0039E15225
KPPFNAHTLLLWLAPVLCLLGLGVFFMRQVRPGEEAAAGPPPALSTEEERRLAELLGPSKKPAGRG